MENVSHECLGCLVVEIGRNGQRGSVFVRKESTCSMVWHDFAFNIIIKAELCDSEFLRRLQKKQLHVFELG